MSGSLTAPEEHAVAVRSWRPVAASSFPAFAMLYLALFGAFGTESPFFPVFLAARGLTPEAIGSLLAASIVVRLATGPFVGLAADRFGTRRVLALVATGTGLIFLLYLADTGPALLVAICLVHAVTIAPLTPLADALALNASLHERSFAYGWVRGLGSAGFILGTLASGILVARFGTGSIMVAASVLFLTMLVPLRRLPPPPVASTARARGGFAALLAIPTFRWLMVVAGLVIGSHAMSDAFAIIQWRGNGVSAPLSGLLWSAAVGSEIVVFVALGPWLLARWSPARCAMLSAGAGILRWALFATTTNVFLIGAAQLLHGLTFSLMHLVGMRIIAAVVPEELSSTAQTFYGTLCIGITTASLTLIAGKTYGLFGAPAFWLMAVLCALALALAPRLQEGRPQPYPRKTG